MSARSNPSSPSGSGRLARTSIGLDVGSTAVRAAEVRVRGGGWEVVRYGQVGIGSGVVVDGEIRDAAEVTAAIRRLWAAAGFSHRRVVLGVSGPRVVVRQADAPDVPTKEMRSALSFRIEDLVPLPSANVEFDLKPIEARSGTAGGDRTVVLAAAHGEVVRAAVGAAEAARLQVQAVDAVPLALVRAASSPAPAAGAAGAELLVSVGGDLSVLAVMHAGQPAFIRILGRGGSDVTRAVAEATSHNLGMAEAAKRSGDGVWAEPLGRGAADAEVRRLVTEVRETLAFFRSRPDAVPAVERVLVGGGGVRTAGLVGALADDLALPVSAVEVPSPAQLCRAGLAPAEAVIAAPAAMTPVGLALWPVAPEYSRLDLYPASLRAAARRRAVNTAAVGAAAVVVVACLAGAGARELQLRQAHRQLAATEGQVAATRAEAARYQSVTSLQSEVTAARSRATQALTGDVDWLGLLGDIGRRQPKGVTLQSFSGSATALLGQTPQVPTPGSPPTVGSLTMQGSFDGSIPQVSAWIRALESIPGLQDTWVSSVSAPTPGQGSSSGGSAATGSFQATANLGTQTLGRRAEQLPGGTK